MCNGVLSAQSLRLVQLPATALAACVHVLDSEKPSVEWRISPATDPICPLVKWFHLKLPWESSDRTATALAAASSANLLQWQWKTIQETESFHHFGKDSSKHPPNPNDMFRTSGGYSLCCFPVPSARQAALVVYKHRCQKMTNYLNKPMPKADGKAPAMNCRKVNQGFPQQLTPSAFWSNGSILSCIGNLQNSITKPLSFPQYEFHESGLKSTTTSYSFGKVSFNSVDDSQNKTRCHESYCFNMLNKNSCCLFHCLHRIKSIQNVIPAESLEPPWSKSHDLELWRLSTPIWQAQPQKTKEHTLPIAKSSPLNMNGWKMLEDYDPGKTEV